MIPIAFESPPRLSADADQEIVDDFVAESIDHIEAAEALLLALESQPDDSEAVNTIFRAFHTVKGNSAFLELDRVQKVAHLAEDLLSRARNGEIEITGHYADLVLRSCDALRFMIEDLGGVEPGGAVPVPPDLPDLLERLLKPDPVTDIDGPKVVEATEDSDAAGSLETGGRTIGDILIEERVVEPEAVVRASELQQLGDPRRIGEILVEREGVPGQAIVNALNKQQRTGSSSIRVSTHRLDELVNLVCELVVAQSMLAQDAAANASTELADKVENTGKLSYELQDLALSLRMVPLKPAFDKLQRVARDLARKNGKSIRFVTQGGDTEVDRNVVQAIADPLVHMIRNAADHGIESCEERRKKGKPETGCLTLSAYHLSGSVIIEVSDDGDGLDHEAIVAKALSKGLINPGSQLSEDQISELIFHPGFSTAKAITDVSGRGVGMDVVRRGIESLRGSIKVSSKLGVGTSFRISLPQMMAITDSMLLEVASERYLVPTLSILQSFRPEPEALHRVLGSCELVVFQEESIPILRLHKLFGVKNAVETPESGILVVMESEGHRCALLGDRLLGQQEVMTKSLGALGRVAGISGGAILADGSVGLVLDPSGIMNLARNHADGEQ